MAPNVVYIELKPDDPNKWFVFENDVPREVPMQVGIPVSTVPGVMAPEVRLIYVEGSESSDPFSNLELKGGTITLPVLETPQHF